MDTVTSGAICIPLNYFSQRIGIEAFRNGRVEKHYLALVYGLVSEDEIRIETPVGDDARNPKVIELGFGLELHFCVTDFFFLIV